MKILETARRCLQSAMTRRKQPTYKLRHYFRLSKKKPEAFFDRLKEPPRRFFFVCITHSQMALRVGADGLERLFTDVVLYLARPLGDRMEVTVRCYELSLRKADTEMIEVE